jgi:hypothetical protein
MVLILLSVHPCIVLSRYGYYLFIHVVSLLGMGSIWNWMCSISSNFIVVVDVLVHLVSTLLAHFAHMVFN